MGPLITHQDNSSIYLPGKKESIKSGLNYDSMNWNETWYLNTKTERSTIWTTQLMDTESVSTTQPHMTKQYQKTDTVIAVITVIVEVGLMVTA
jgi:hypothetical protein